MSRIEHALNQLGKMDLDPIEPYNVEEDALKNPRKRLGFTRKCTRCKERWAYNRQLCTDCMTEEERQEHLYADENYGWGEARPVNGVTEIDILPRDREHRHSK